MTLSEFKAWLDGFGEAIGDAPTPEQWAKVREKLAQVQEPYALPVLPMEPCVPTSPLTPLDSGVRWQSPPVPAWTPPWTTTCDGSASTKAIEGAMAWNA